MKLNKYIIDRLYKKAAKSHCNYKISAMGFGHDGEMLGTSVNSHRFNRPQGGIHAEMVLMAQYGKNLKTILICRSNNAGTKMMPIHPCINCASKAEELGIKIISLSDILGIKDDGDSY